METGSRDWSDSGVTLSIELKNVGQIKCMRCTRNVFYLGPIRECSLVDNILLASKNIFQL